MTRERLNKLYFDWLYEKVIDSHKSYRELLWYLHSVSFEYLIAMDANRADDGTDLRYRFCYEYDYDDAMVSAYLDDRPCSVLEMMAALAIREEQIMEDQDIGDRTSMWFMEMLRSLKLINMTDSNFDSGYVRDVVGTFLHSEYARNGSGGLFTVSSNHDMRCEEIWIQMNLYLTNTQDIFKEGW